MKTFFSFILSIFLSLSSGSSVSNGNVEEENLVEDVVDSHEFEEPGVCIDETAWSVPARVETWAWRSGRDAKPSVSFVYGYDDSNRTKEGLLKICVSEAGFDGFRDCAWIWKTLINIRSEKCERNKYPLITECVDGKETMVSAMRRASKRVMGMVEPKFRRHYWIRELSMSCDKPPSFPDGVPWSRYHDDCLAMAKFVDGLVEGRPRFRTFGVPIAWGGRCEHGYGACDDWIACKRGLVRIPGTETRNSFWCMPGTRRCPDFEPVCSKQSRD